MVVTCVICLIGLAAIGSLIQYLGYECMALAFASYGGEAIGYFSLGSILLLCGIAFIALDGMVILLWIKSGDW